jgi:DNA-binding response OmpR family regulator
MSPEAGQKIEILIVEDSESVAHCVTLAVEGPRVAISRARDGEEAFAKVTERKFDLVITDTKMPRMTGPELVGRLREQNFAGKIVVLSGEPSWTVGDTYAGLNIDAVVHKPFDFVELRRRIEQFLGD